MRLQVAYRPVQIRPCAQYQYNNKGVNKMTTKTIDGMAYEATGTKKTTNGKAASIKIAEQLSTYSLIWLLVKRHKVAILAAGNVVLVLNYAIPAWPTILRSMF